MQKISVSKLLNLYFDPVDINLYPIQRGIFRGIGVDVAIQNFYDNNCKGEIKLPDKSEIIKRISNKRVISEANEIYKETNCCLDGFKKLYSNSKLIISDAQKLVKNNFYPVYGYYDSLISIKNKKYLVDWKCKGKFSEYNYLTDTAYNEYTKWCKNNGKKSISLNSHKKRIKSYSLSHLRYCLQIMLYYLLLGEPKEVIPLIIYFDNEKNYHVYSFNVKNAKKMCITLINGFIENKGEIFYQKVNKKFKKDDWITFIEWKKLLYNFYI